MAIGNDGSGSVHLYLDVMKDRLSFSSLFVRRLSALQAAGRQEPETDNFEAK